MLPSLGMWLLFPFLENGKFVSSSDQSVYTIKIDDLNRLHISNKYYYGIGVKVKDVWLVTWFGDESGPMEGIYYFNGNKLYGWYKSRIPDSYERLK